MCGLEGGDGRATVRMAEEVMIYEFLAGGTRERAHAAIVTR